MKLLCKIVLSGISMIVPLLAQTGLEAPKFSLTISGPQKVALGSNITIEIKLANTSQERLSFVFGQHALCAHIQAGAGTERARHRAANGAGLLAGKYTIPGKANRKGRNQKDPDEEIDRDAPLARRM